MNLLEDLLPVVKGEDDLPPGPALIAQRALVEASDLSFCAANLYREIEGLEADRHSRKEEAIRRLMLPPTEGEKGLSRTAAADLVATDPAYRDYLKHLADRRAKLDETRDALRVAHGTADLCTALIGQGVVA